MRGSWNRNYLIAGMFGMTSFVGGLFAIEHYILVSTYFLFTALAMGFMMVIENKGYKK